MKWFTGFSALLCLVSILSVAAKGNSPMIDSITPVLPVDRIEPSASFFEKIGFKRDSEVPQEDGSLGFVIMTNGKSMVMYQTKASIREDSDVLAEGADVAPVLLYVIVSDVRAVAATLKADFNQVMELRETFYGATEVSFKEPGGHIVTFAEFKTEE